MRLSHLFGTTLREAPAGVEAESQKLLLRAGYIRQLGQGLYSYLPLARRALAKIESIMRREIDAIGGQELTMPVVHPAELWKATGRYYSIGPEMARLRDRRERELVLAMTHEEVVAELAKSEILSYRQLPQLIYQIQTKFRDDPRPRAGLIRVREFTMKDSYSLDADEAGLDAQYRAHYQAYFNIFNRCALPTIAVGSDVGMMGGSAAHEYMYLAPIGEDTLVLCGACGYAANRQVARFAKPAAEPEQPAAAAKVATPGASTIDELAALLGVPASKTAKAVMFVAGFERDGGTREEFVFAVVRGDMEANETKLVNAARADWLRPATDDEIRAAGAVPGYASPIGLHRGIVIADEAIASSPNLVAGANEEGFHLVNTNVPRDWSPTAVADIAAARDGDRCIACGSTLRTARGVEVGNIFKLGTRYSAAAGATYLAADGTQRPIIMGSYGIGSGRLLACIAEEHHDERGLMLPITVAPFEVHLVALSGSDPDVAQQAERVYRQLADAHIEVLFDDRSESAGVKFADADLIGAPIRVTVSAKSLRAGGAELKRRASSESRIESVHALLGAIEGLRRTLSDEIERRVVAVPFR